MYIRFYIYTCTHIHQGSAAYLPDSKGLRTSIISHHFKGSAPGQTLCMHVRVKKIHLFLKRGKHYSRGNCVVRRRIGGRVGAGLKTSTCIYLHMYTFRPFFSTKEKCHQEQSFSARMRGKVGRVSARVYLFAVEINL